MRGQFHAVYITQYYINIGACWLNYNGSLSAHFHIRMIAHHIVSETCFSIGLAGAIANTIAYPKVCIELQRVKSGGQHLA